MKRDRIIYWISTAIIFIWDGVMPAFTSHTEVAVEGIRHLGYPDYFRVWFTVFKVIGSIILILPFFKGRIKEWVYAGFSFDFIFAFISHWAVGGLNAMTLFPLIVFAILIVSYIYYHKVYGVHAKKIV